MFTSKFQKLSASKNAVRKRKILLDGVKRKTIYETQQITNISSVPRIYKRVLFLLRNVLKLFHGGGNYHIKTSGLVYDRDLRHKRVKLL